MSALRYQSTFAIHLRMSLSIRQSRLLLSCAGVLAIATTTSLAVYFGDQAKRLRQERDAAQLELRQLRMEQASREASIPAQEGSQLAAAAAQATSAPKREAPQAESVTIAEPARTETARQERPRRSGSEWLDNLRTNDPSRYETIQKWREDIQTHMETVWSQKTNYFTNRDTSKMTEAEFQEYSLMVKLMNDTWTLGQKLQAGLEHDDRHQVMSNIHSNMTALGPLLENEKNREFRDLAIGMGQTEQQAMEFVGYANQILSNTSMRTMMPGGGRGFGGGPGFGGGFFRVPGSSRTDAANRPPSESPRRTEPVQ